jgi:phosphoribosylformylglycinamidine synthase
VTATPFPIPIAHAEGRFWTRDEAVRASLPAHVALTYRNPDHTAALDFPWNPNGSLESAAGITNRQGNVLAMMPHPERALMQGQVPEPLREKRRVAVEAEGPGVPLFRALVEAVRR